jgi:ATP-dependent DNA ligase
MQLPVMPPVAPMLAKAVTEIPVGQYVYEPKWDGFRCIVFRDGDEVELGSRNGRPLTRYFPEVVEAVRACLPTRCVLDGEVVVAGPAGLDFDLLSQRIHPADSRVRMLAETTPAQLVVWDLLALGDADRRAEPFSVRRSSLVEVVPERPASSVHLTPLTQDPALARLWFEHFEGAGLDGVVAKSQSLPYLEDRRAMFKIKHERTAEFVVGGFRWHRTTPGAVGSLMLGLYDAGQLVHVGVIGSFPAAQRRSLVDVLAPYALSAVDGMEIGAGEPSGKAGEAGGSVRERQLGRHPWAVWAEAMADGSELPGARSRWSADRDLSFVPLRPELVVEAAFEHLQAGRLRHTARFRRWRPDRDPASCTYDQVAVAPPALLADVFTAR